MNLKPSPQTFKLAKQFLEERGLGPEHFDKMADYYFGETSKLNKIIVSIETFIKSRNYLDARDQSGKLIIYPAVLKTLIELNSGQYSEAVLTGGIGTAKTTICLYTIAYQLYLLSCMRHPHSEFDLDPSSEILFVFQNLKMGLAKAVDYDRFRAMIERAPYFQKHFPYNKDIKSELQFPNRIIVKPVSGEPTAAIGQNIIGGMLDEVNFMEVIEDSKRSTDGGTYNQAESLYNSLARRRESRFMRGGRLPGILCMSSSKRYPGEFTDMKIREAREDHTIYVYDKRTWDIKPEGTYCGEMFKVFTGDLTRNPFIMDDTSVIDVKDEQLVLDVPVEYKKQFNHDIMEALREIGGIALRSTHPFIMDVSAIADASGKTYSILNRNEAEFKTEKLLILPKKVKYPDEPRYVHIDLGVTHDNAGIVMGCVPKFMDINRGGTLIEKLPFIHIDFAVAIKPPRNDEIDFGKIRGLIYKLRELGVLIKWVSLDSFQSVDMIQRLRAKGFIAGTLSMDSAITPYIFCKNALLDRRVGMPYHPKLEKELRELELDEEKSKVDHPPHGSKDISDALAGVIYGLTMRRETWIKHLDSTFDMQEFQKRYLHKDIKQDDYQTV